MKKHYLSIYKICLFGLTLLLSSSFLAQNSSDIFGTWISIDDKTGKQRSKIEIYKKGDKAYGKIIKFLENPDKETTQRCTKCPKNDDRKDELVFGMEIIRDLELDDGKWENGTILDPEEGKIYDCKIWQEDGKLKVRGYIAFFFRTQEWIKAE